MKKFLTPVIALSFLAHVAAPANGAVIAINEVIDARSIVSSQGVNGTSPPFSLSVGDTLNLRFSFLPGQALQLDGFNAMLAFLSGTGATNSDVTNSNAMSFIALSGAAHNPSPSLTTTIGTGLISAFYANDILNNPPFGSFSFTGIDFTIGIISYADGATSKLFQTDSFAVIATDIGVLSVPEVGPRAMLLLGLACVALRLVRRRTEA